MSQVRKAGVVLGLFAHPDDETFGPGGTMARVTSEGHALHILSATRGEAGTIGESASMGREKLAAVRTAELEAACRVLGAHPPRILGLPDSGLAALEEDALLVPFVEEIRRVKPDLIVTFEPQGISGHPDHRTVTARSVIAFDRAAEAGHRPELGPSHATQRLWAYTVPETRALRMAEFRKLHSTPDRDIDAFVDVLAFISAKRAAVAAHASQKPFIDNLEAHVGSLVDHWNPEAFVLLRSRAPLPKRPVEDLFQGLLD